MIEVTPLFGLYEILGVLLLAFLGFPIAITLGTVGFISAILYYGGLPALELTGATAWMESFSYSLTMIPLFVFMGALIAESGLGKMAFDCIYAWTYKIKGNLAIAATFASAAFGAISGSSAATIATIGGISMPEMRRRNYSESLSTGSIATASILANLIPPSTVAIIFCILTDVSIGKVFIAGIIPGIILAIMYAATIYVWVWLKPSAAPMPGGGETFSWRERFISLRGPVPILVIFIIMIGGIYRGVFSATEAAGIGVVCTVALIAGMKRLNWANFKLALHDAMRVTAMIMFIVMGAFLFTHTVAITKFPGIIIEMVEATGFSGNTVMWLITVVFIVFGCFMDLFAIQVLFIPLFFPLIQVAGFDPIWYGTYCVMMTEIALITPPIAGNIYIAQMLLPGSTIGNITKGVIPFYVASLGLVALLIYFPQLALWLPGTMG